MIKIRGVIERITFQSEETGYIIAKLHPENSRSKNLITIVGTLPLLSAGESLLVIGEWTTHPKYGKQFKISDYRILAPATLEGIRRYLGSGLIKGIGPVTAKRIVKQFGLETLNIIENAPERLQEVEGIAHKRVEMISTAWETQKEIKDVMLFLQSHKVSINYAVKIYKQYGNQSILVVRENPYRLADDIWGIGFKTADKIAMNLGINPEATIRLKSGLKHTLSKASDNGHIYLPMLELLKDAPLEDLGAFDGKKFKVKKFFGQTDENIKSTQRLESQ